VGAYSAPPGSLAVFNGGLLLREGRGKGWRKRERERGEEGKRRGEEEGKGRKGRGQVTPNILA